jgi:hypothetical protein
MKKLNVAALQMQKLAGIITESEYNTEMTKMDKMEAEGSDIEHGRKEVKEFFFGYDIGNITEVQEYLIANYKVDSNHPDFSNMGDDKNPDCEIWIGYGDDTMNAFTVFNPAMLQDKQLLRLIEDCEGGGEYEEEEDSEFDEQ